MGIGRRDFLKFASMALGGIVLDPLRTIAINGDFYVNLRLGLGFEKPYGWSFDSYKDFGSILKGQIVENIEPEDEEAFRKDETSTLVAVLSKYGLEYPSFGLAITIYKNEEDRAKYESMDEIIDTAINGFAYLLKDFTVVAPPAPVRLSNCECMRFKSRWLFRHEQCPSMLIDDITLVIDQDPILYTIHLYDAPGKGEVAQREFESFTRSLRIA